jgi:hypothetical protein
LITLNGLVLAVEKNNEINNGQWADWFDAHTIIDTYSDNDEIADQDIAQVIEILNKAISTSCGECSFQVATQESFGGR